MTTFTLQFSNLNTLTGYIKNNNIQNSNKVLIQIFYSDKSKKDIIDIKNHIIKILPDSSVIGASSAGTIYKGEILDDTIIISFSLFEDSYIQSIAYKNTDSDTIIKNLTQNFIKHETKLLIAFANTFTFDGNTLLNKLSAALPNLIIAGGNAADNFNFTQCHVFSESCDESDIVIAIINSQKLQIQTEYLFNWETIGNSMSVTHSEGSTVYTLNHKKIIDIYEEYLGKEVRKNLLQFAMEFPLIFKDKGTTIARSLVAFNEEEGSMTFAGNIPQGINVQFGFANIEYIQEKNKQTLLEKFQYQHESMFIYSCAGRRHTLDTLLQNEINTLNYIAENSGFLTYGEFFHNQNTCNNDLLNITTTLITLNENQLNTPIEIKNKDIPFDQKDIRLKALTNLITKTSQNLDEKNHYLKQFKKIVEESSIFSKTDEQGIIVDINSNFEKISGYTKKELIGQSHSIVKNPAVESDIFKDLWNTILSKKTWHGLMKNKRKNGLTYHVLANISPIYYKDGRFKEFITIQHDVTKLEEYKEILKYELHTKSKNLESNLNYTKQYENGINTTIAILKTDTNNIITYANDKFLELSEYTSTELIGMDCDQLRNTQYKNLEKPLRQGDIIELTSIHTSKKGNKLTTNIVFYPIFDLHGNIIEILQIINDITDIIELNREIIDTQREVVSTMGAIGETRSKETGLHVKRVAEYSYLLAKLYGLNEEEANLLKQASPMHDIGKVGIPDNILNKPGKLTKEEFEIMKSHSNLGYEMLKHSKREILQASATIAISHHEKWDGSGYPKGLKEENIHVFGRITAIADVFDALGHDRCYKKSWKIEDILKLFQEEKGKHFEPKLVDLFFDNLDQFLKIKDELND
jgi:PAS domain S-box-containing protein